MLEANGLCLDRRHVYPSLRCLNFHRALDDADDDDDDVTVVLSM